MPKGLHGKIANILITILGFNFFRDLSNQPALSLFKCDCNFKFHFCNQPFFTLTVYSYSSLEKLTTSGKFSLFGVVALIFVLLIFAYGLLKKKPNFILFWILGEAFNLVVLRTWIFKTHYPHLPSPACCTKKKKQWLFIDCGF